MLRIVRHFILEKVELHVSVVRKCVKIGNKGSRVKKNFFTTFGVNSSYIIFENLIRWKAFLRVHDGHSTVWMYSWGYLVGAQCNLQSAADGQLRVLSYGFFFTCLLLEDVQDKKMSNEEVVFSLFHVLSLLKGLPDRLVNHTNQSRNSNPSAISVASSYFLLFHSSLLHK